MSRSISTSLSLCIASVAFLGGCSFMARDAETYKSDTRSVLERNKTGVKACYDDAEAANQELNGKTVVNFTVQAKTGQFVNASIDPSSTAPDALNQCILKTVEGLNLDPVDQRDGNATFTWKFQSGRSNNA